MMPESRLSHEANDTEDSVLADATLTEASTETPATGVNDSATNNTRTETRTDGLSEEGVLNTSFHQYQFASPRHNVLYHVVFTLASTVAGLSSVCIKQLLLPLQVSLLDPVTTNTSFALVAAIGAFAGMIASPLSGALSDRTTLRWGRRRPWMCGGIVVAACGLFLMARSTTIPLLLVGEILAQVGVDTVLSCVTAIIPDQVPPARRSLLAALNGMAPIVGGVFGLLLVTLFTQTSDPAQGYLLLAGVSLLGTLPFLLVVKETPLAHDQRPPFRFLLFLHGFVAPLRSRDFVCMLLSRCLVFLTFTMLGAYLLFSLRARWHVSAVEAAQSMTRFQLFSTGMVLATSIIGGILAHHLKRLKPFVIVGALLMALGVALLAFFPAWGTMLVAALTFGCGWGLYLGVDVSLAVRVLPSTSESGKDLGIMYISIFLPLILNPVIGATVLNTTGNNYTILFTVAACSSVLAAATILPIRSVR